MTYQLRGNADGWWKTWRNGIATNAPSVEWEEFKKAFMDRFIPPSVRTARAQEFEHLKQGSMTVDEYDTQFVKLLEYDPHLILNEEERIKMSVGFMIPYIRKWVLRQRFFLQMSLPLTPPE